MRNIFILFTIVFFLISCATQNDETTSTLKNTTTTVIQNTTTSESINSTTTTVASTTTTTTILLQKQNISVIFDNSIISKDITVDLGSIKKGNYKDFTFTIDNTGDLDLKFTENPPMLIYDFGKYSEINNNLYSIVSFPTENVIKGKESTTFTIRFEPGKYSLERYARIYIYNNSSIYTNNFNFLTSIKVEERETYELVYKFGIEGSNDGEFQTVGGYDIDSSGNIYITDKGNNRIQKFDPSGNFISKYGSDGTDDGEFSSPTSLLIDSNNNIFVIDSENNRVQKFDSSFNFITKFSTTYNNISTTAFLKNDTFNNIYIIDSSWRRIEKYDQNGNLITKYTKYNCDVEWVDIADVVISPSGNMYVADYSGSCIHIYDSSGDQISKFGSIGENDGQFNAPQGITIDKTGNVYVADTVNRTIQKFDASGNFLGIFKKNNPNYTYFTWIDGDFESPIFITIDSNNYVYISDSSFDKIQKFDLSGNYITSISRSGTDDEEIRYGKDIKVDSFGNVYLFDYDSSKKSIQKWSNQ